MIIYLARITDLGEKAKEVEGEERKKNLEVDTSLLMSEIEVTSFKGKC